MQIPITSVTATLSDEGTPSDGKTKQIRFDCGGCGKTLSIPATNAGKKGKCLNCGELMAIPASSQTRWRGSPTDAPQEPDGA
jgi:ribosomal protein S27E